MLGGPSLSYGHPFLGIFLMARSTEARPILETMKPADAERERIFDAFRRWGYLAADSARRGFFARRRPPNLALTAPVRELPGGTSAAPIAERSCTCLVLAGRRGTAERFKPT